MVILSSKNVEERAVMHVAEMMVSSARTAPKGRGIDKIAAMIVNGKEKEQIADEMEQIADEMEQIADEMEQRGYPERAKIFTRDAKSLRKALMTVLIGVEGTKSKGWNCSGCGYDSCAEFDKIEKKVGQYNGPNCIAFMLDLGVALCSSVKIASDLNIDNRIMYTVGVAAKQIGLMEGADVIVGIPLSVTGKNIFFDR